MRQRWLAMVAGGLLTVGVVACSDGDAGAPRVRRVDDVGTTASTTASPPPATTLPDATTTSIRPPVTTGPGPFATVPEPPTTASRSTTTTFPSLGPDQQPVTLQEMQAVVGSVPQTGGGDPDVELVRPLAQAAVDLIAAGQLAPADFFEPLVLPVPDGLVLSRYLVCPAERDQQACGASIGDYRALMAPCATQPRFHLTVSAVGPSFPVAAGVCVWRPTYEDLDALLQLARTTMPRQLERVGLARPLSEVGAAQAQRLVDFNLAHPGATPDDPTPEAAALRDQLVGLIPANGHLVHCLGVRIFEPAAFAAPAMASELAPLVDDLLADRSQPFTATFNVGYALVVTRGMVSIGACIAG